MATIKVKFRPSTVAEHPGSIYYQVIHQRKVRQITSVCHLFASEWDEQHERIKMCRETKRNDYLLDVRERIHNDKQRLTRIIRRFERNVLEYSADEVIAEYLRYTHTLSISNYMEGFIRKFKRNGRVRTAETYASTLKSFMRFREDEDIMLDSINAELIEAYQAWLTSRGVTPNSSSFYMRILRAAYNRAVEDNLIEDTHPFKHVYTGIDKTVKRALPIPAIKRIKALDLSLYPTLDYARDIFLLSFYLRGMSFVDMAFLKKTDLKDGYVTYRRRKTGQQLCIAWTKEMQQIVDKYPENTTVYRLPIIHRQVNNERSMYRNIAYNINRNLKKIAGMIGLAMPLTLYVARHSWASAARSKGIPLSVISEGMGHDSETTTRIYLASLDTSAIDKANALIINSI